ncbi:MAG: glucuronyl hydrolase, partial [Alistipes sp.]|nr:glucuronyl hydrolase [Alistipes sp.]
MKKILSVMFVAAFGFGCTSTPTEARLIEENLNVAVAQIGSLNRSSLETGTPRIPSTYADGEIKYVPTDDWVSGFFAGTLWHMYLALIPISEP